MITYELAKQLKEAGFPFLTEVIEQVGKSCIYCGYPFLEIDGKLYLEPNLNILIEACGDAFIGLDKGDNSWSAAGSNEKTLTEETGQSPEEAVARLWLKLNEKK